LDIISRIRFLDSLLYSKSDRITSIDLPLAHFVENLAFYFTSLDAGLEIGKCHIESSK